MTAAEQMKLPICMVDAFVMLVNVRLVLILKLNKFNWDLFVLWLARLRVYAERLLFFV